MSYNPNFYRNFPPQSTFQRPNFIPPPPPPSFYFPPPIRAPISDQEFVKQFDKVPPKLFKHKTSPNLSINQVKDKLRNLVVVLNDIKEKEAFLKANIHSISEEEWVTILTNIEESKTHINDSIAKINDSFLDTLRRRKIDENLQKIKDDINKAKQEEEQKLQADMILKETLRKKQDAKKCITKLDALLKLYKARQNTARGRGETVSEKDAEVFGSNIEKLKSLWVQKLHLYEKEESDLRATLQKASDAQNAASMKDAHVLQNLEKWREFMFGGNVVPQRDFQGDIGSFVAVRSQWDQFISPEGTSLPVGWVLPNLKQT
ncbi:programmed cell death protein 7 domain-containing protein [Phthorimaea operculella]|nr:programmed cell death protein 7 domain-containing protein [Phthorimaea operculella]